MREIRQMDYLFKTAPFEHQRKAFLLSRDRDEYALFMEQGTGKSKVIIDTAAWLYSYNKMQLIIIVAPNGVHRNWANNEIPAHLPEHVPHVSRIWSTSKSGTKKYQKYLDEIFVEGDVLRFFMINIDAIITKKGCEIINRLLNIYTCMIVVDESHFIKNWNIKRSKLLVKLGKRARYRRILTGTPLTQGPTDIYGQFLFLNEELLGFGSFYTFQNRYSVMVQDMPEPLLKRMPYHERKEVYLLRHLKKTSPFVRLESKNPDGTVKYQHMEELKEKMAPHSFRVTKKECLDLPEKLYQKRYVELSAQQAKYYAQLRDELLIEIDEGQLTAPLMLTRLLRLQQIIGGNLPLDEGHALELECPRFDVLLEILQATEGKAIIWARFTAEILRIMELLHPSAVAYYGDVSATKREENLIAFVEDPSIKYFVGNARAGGTGLTLHVANTVIYYSNDFSLTNRLQSEDRAHRIGQKNPVTYFDLVAEETIDEKIIDTLRGKQDVANIITGDQVKNWL